MLDPESLSETESRLIEVAGGYLRNIIREPGITCRVCATPTKDGYQQCYPCLSHERYGPGRTADRVASLTYARPDHQSGLVMSGYKGRSGPVSPEHRLTLALLTLPGVYRHGACAGRLAGRQITHWAVTPSLPRQDRTHPLHAFVAPVAPGAEVRLTAASEVDAKRLFAADHFTAPALPAESHVLLLDDTWVGGGHAQSAGLALRNGGAAEVSILTIARWLDPQPGFPAQGFIRNRLKTADFNPQQCPWTGSACP
jgi:hypothetical protein